MIYTIPSSIYKCRWLVSIGTRRAEILKKIEELTNGEIKPSDPRNVPAESICSGHSGIIIFNDPYTGSGKDIAALAHEVTHIVQSTFDLVGVHSDNLRYSEARAYLTEYYMMHCMRAANLYLKRRK